MHSSFLVFVSLWLLGLLSWHKNKNKGQYNREKIPIKAKYLVPIFVPGYFRKVKWGLICLVEIFSLKMTEKMVFLDKIDHKAKHLTHVRVVTSHFQLQLFSQSTLEIFYDPLFRLFQIKTASTQYIFLWPKS